MHDYNWYYLCSKNSMVRSGYKIYKYTCFFLIDSITIKRVFPCGICGMHCPKLSALSLPSIFARNFTSLLKRRKVLFHSFLSFKYWAHANVSKVRSLLWWLLLALFQASVIPSFRRIVFKGKCPLQTLLLVFQPRCSLQGQDSLT